MIEEEHHSFEDLSDNDSLGSLKENVLSLVGMDEELSTNSINKKKKQSEEKKKQYKVYKNN